MGDKPSLLRLVVRCLCVIVAILIIWVAFSEWSKLCRVDEDDVKYKTQHVIANAFVNTCQEQMRVLLSLKETLRDYQTEINRYADSGSPSIKDRIEKLAEHHKAMKSSLQRSDANLSSLVNENYRIVPDSYRVDLGHVQTVTSGLVGIIDRITVPNPQQYVYVDGLPLYMHDEFVRLQIPVESMLSTYNIEKYENYKQHLRKDEIVSQHRLAVLAALIALFFNIVTICELWNPKRHSTR